MSSERTYAQPSLAVCKKAQAPLTGAGCVAQPHASEQQAPPLLLVLPPPTPVLLLPPPAPEEASEEEHATTPSKAAPAKMLFSHRLGPCSGPTRRPTDERQDPISHLGTRS